MADLQLNPRIADRFLDCVHCGLCLSQCPTYAELGDENDSPRGRIYLMRHLSEGRLEPTERVLGHLDLCLDCRACESACPSGVRYGSLIETMRGRLAEQGIGAKKNGWADRLLARFMFDVFPYPRKLNRWLWLARLGQAVGLNAFLRESGLIRLLPGSVARMEAMLPPHIEACEPLPAHARPDGPVRARVAMFRGCVSESIFGPSNRAMLRVLLANDCEVFIPDAQGCCGAIHHHGGRHEESEAMARANIDAFEALESRDLRNDDLRSRDRKGATSLQDSGTGGREPLLHGGGSAPVRSLTVAALPAGPLPDGRGSACRSAPLRSRLGQETAPLRSRLRLDDIDAIVTNVAGCGTMLKEYNELLHHDRAYSERAERFVAKMKDISEFLADLPLKPPTRPVRARVTYHEACHLCHGQQIRSQPRALLKAIPGLELVELAESDWCCGAAGTYNLTQPEMSARLAERKLLNVDRTGAAVVATANAGCLMQLLQHVRSSGRSVEVVHPIDLLDAAYHGNGHES